MRIHRRAAFAAVLVASLIAESPQSASAATTVITNVIPDATQGSLLIYGQNFCTSPAPQVYMFIPPNVAAGQLLAVTSFGPTLITATLPAGNNPGGIYLFFVNCAGVFNGFAVVLDPEPVGPTLGANTFSGIQTAPGFAGSGASLTNLPIPNGAATLGPNTFIGNQTITGALHVTSDAVVDGNIGAKYQDVAEWVDSAEPLTPGTIVVIDPAGHNRVVASTQAYATSVAGAVSGQPGILLGEPGAGRILVAQSGRVRIKADAHYGTIKAGDLLVSSPTRGYAMRSRPISIAGQRIHRPGTVLGKALEALPAGRGEILVLLTLQ